MYLDANTDLTGRSRQIGRHLLRIEEDCLFFYPIDAPTLEEVMELHAEVDPVLARYGWAFMVIDGSQGLSISPEVRRWIVEWHRQRGPTPGGTVTVGAGILVRTFMSLLINAIRALKRYQLEFGFVPDEAAARAWVRDQRLQQGLRLPMHEPRLRSYEQGPS